MSDEKLLYFDLKITRRDFTLDSGAEPVLCKNRDSIGQDIVHMIIESELTKKLIAERSPLIRLDVVQQLEQLVETDERIVPGTVTITEAKVGSYQIDADTWDFGPLAAELTL